MPSIPLLIAVFTFLISLNAFFVVVEFSTTSARRSLLSQKAEAGSHLVGLAENLLQHPRQVSNLLVVAQIGISASSIVLGFYLYNSLSQVVNLSGEPAEAPNAFALFSVFGAALLLIGLLQVTLGEAIPRAIALHIPERLVQLIVVPIRPIIWLLKPFIWLCNRSADLSLNLVGLSLPDDLSRSHSHDEIERLVSGSHEGGLIDDEERQLLRNALKLRELTARQVMLPRTRVVAAGGGTSTLDLLTLAIENGFSRIPIYAENIDNITHFVHIKDLFAVHLSGQGGLGSILREAVFVPEGMPAIEVWNTLNSQRQYLAIVFDEHGGTAGIITFEDLIEEIFGELQDEFDEEVAPMFEDAQGFTHLRADLLIQDVNEYLNLDLPEDQAETLGGLIFTTLGYLPEAGETVAIGETTLKIETITNFTINEVSLRLPEGSTTNVHEWEANADV
jgi:CBS domain containing-hemolysin-like protein